MQMDAKTAGERLDGIRTGYKGLEADTSRLVQVRDDAKKRLDALDQDLPLTSGPGSPLAPAGWDELGEAKRTQLSGELERLALDIAEQSYREPDAGNWMQSRAFVTPRWTLALVIASIVCVFVLCILIYACWDAATGSGLPSSEIVAWNEAYATLAEEHRKVADEKYRAESSALSGAEATAAEQAAAKAARETAEKARATRFKELTTAIDDKSLALHQALGAPRTNERSVVWMVFLFGALGGSLRWLVSIVQYVGNRQLRRSWVAHYVSLPFLGAGLGLVFYLLLRVGILSAPASGSGEVLLGVNVLGFYALAALTGLFAKDALDKLAEVFGTFFNVQRKDKDSLEEGAAEAS